MAQWLELPIMEQYTIPVIAVKMGYTWSKELGLFVKTLYAPAEAASAAANAASNASASAIFDSYVGAGNGVTSLGGGAIRQAVSNLTLTLKNGATAAAGLLATPLPTAFAALAPFAGVAAGVGLYNLNPDFWERVSRVLLPHVWKAIDGTGASSYVKTVVDSNGTTYMPKAAVDAIKSLITDYRSNFSGYHITGNFQMSHGTIGETLPLHDGMEFARWENAEIGAQLTDGMQLIIDGVTKIVRIAESPEGYEDEFQGTIIGIFDYPPAYNPARKTKKDWDLEVYIDSITGDTNRPIHWIWHNKPWTIEIKPYLVEINDLVYIGVEIANGDNPYPPNIEWQPDRYILTAKPFPATEIDYKPHTIEEELPQIDPATITQPSIQVITGTDADGEPETEEYVPVPLPNGDPTPYIMPNPNEFPDDYPFDPIAPALPNPTPTGTPKTTTDPETDPSLAPETQPETQPDTPTLAPPDEGDTPEFPLPIPYPVYTNARGLIRVYNPSISEIRNFGAWLWTTWSGNVTDTLQKLFLNAPLDAIIGLHELYATPKVVGRANIKCGFLDSEIESNLVDERYTEINCGSVIVPEFYANYLDYAPYTRISAYLPFVGIVNLETDDIVGHAVNITYRVDSYTGCVAALVTVAKNGYNALLYQFEGNAAVTIPLSSGNQNAMIASALSIGASAIGGAISGGIAGAVGGAFAGGLRAMGGAKASVAHSGAFGGTFGAMGVKKPYLIIRRPVKKEAAYRDVSGLPAYKRVYLSACSGFVRVRDCEFKSATATAEEKRMVVEALKQGVIV